MSTYSQRETLEDLVMGNGLGAVRWRPTPSGKVWGSGLGAPPSNPREAEAQRDFLEWMRKAYGDEVAELIAIRAQELTRKQAPRDNGLGQSGDEAADETEDRAWWEKIVDAGAEVLPKYLEYKQQAEIIDIQMQRAREGKPPLNTNEYAPSVQVGLDQTTVERIADEAQRRASRAGGAIMQNPLAWIAAGVGAFMLFRSMN